MYIQMFESFFRDNTSSFRMLCFARAEFLIFVSIIYARETAVWEKFGIILAFENLLSTIIPDNLYYLKLDKQIVPIRFLEEYE